MTYVGIISLIFSIMDIHGYKVPSKPLEEILWVMIMFLGYAL
jgi:hypothetical protein